MLSQIPKTTLAHQAITPPLNSIGNSPIVALDRIPTEGASVLTADAKVKLLPRWTNFVVEDNDRNATGRELIPILEIGIHTCISRYTNNTWSTKVVARSTAHFFLKNLSMPGEIIHTNRLSKFDNSEFCRMCFNKSYLYFCDLLPPTAERKPYFTSCQSFQSRYWHTRKNLTSNETLVSHVWYHLLATFLERVARVNSFHLIELLLANSMPIPVLIEG